MSKKKLILGVRPGNPSPVYLAENKDGYIMMMQDGQPYNGDDWPVSVLDQETFSEDSLIRNWTDCALEALDEAVVDYNTLYENLTNGSGSWAKTAVRAVRKAAWDRFEQIVSNPDKVCEGCPVNESCTKYGRKNAANVHY